ncbi:MAG: hypothetical protein Ct9H90mP22_1920 [Gammaproteobacteria bacterium]|nr:MAG: hypothetical protein Ct9H90mP22_1920 [Gammaproteobacteria bacterium]
MIVDGTDNFATRYLVNDAFVILGKPKVYGSIFRFEGAQTTVFNHKDGLITGIYTPSHRHPEWFHHVPKVEFWESCLELLV